MNTRSMTRGRRERSSSPGVGLTTDEWRAVRTSQANVLFVGPDSLTEPIVNALAVNFRQPIERWRPGVRFFLRHSSCTGTLILENVGAMARSDQQRLCEWLDLTGGRTRVCSTSPQPLLPLLDAGRFAATLYYRLNVLCFPVGFVNTPEPLD